jgi:hypothetical protein
MNMNKTVTMRILRKLHKNARIKVINRTVKQVDKSIFFGNKENSVGEINRRINMKLQNSSKFCQMIRG